MTILRLGIAVAVFALIGLGTGTATAGGSYGGGGGYGGDPWYGDEPSYCEPPPQTCWPLPPGSYATCGGPQGIKCAPDTRCEVYNCDAATAADSGCWGVCKPPPDRGCPPGYDCSCIPPGPLDATTAEETEKCGAYVCTQSRCESACDCEPGWGCNKGTCERGHEPSFCCERVNWMTGPGKDTCPYGEHCETRRGDYGYCPREDVCEHEAKRASYHTEKIVDYFNYCHSDSDCQHVETATSCNWDCGAYVNRKSVQSVKYHMGRVERYACGTWGDYGCGYGHSGDAAPSAVDLCEPTRARCENYRCVSEPAR